MTYIFILFTCGLSAAVVARWKGNSVLIWFLIGFCLPIIGTVVAYLYRAERKEPRRRCETCGHVMPVTNQICFECGRELDYPDELIAPGALQ